jgi:hypothetical protein
LGNDYLNAVALGNLYYQVENGGFEQWHFNGYSEEGIDILLDFLTSNDIGPTSRRVLEILGMVRDELDWFEDAEKQVRQLDYEYRDMFNECISDKRGNCLSRYDSMYYNIYEDFQQEVEKYFTEKGYTCSSEELVANEGEKI